MDQIFFMLGELIGAVICIFIMSFGFLMIFGVTPSKTMSLWTKHVFKPIIKQILRPFRWLLRELLGLARRGARAGANATGRGLRWLVHQSASLAWRGIRWLGREFLYRVRRAYYGSSYRRP